MGEVGGLTFFASREHYARHMAPTAALLGLPILKRADRKVMTGPVVIAGASDLDQVPRRCPVALQSHGAEQTYIGLDHRSWAGGAHRGRISLYLVPRAETAALNTQRYPESRSAVVGCPALDRYADLARGGYDREKYGKPLVVFTFHPSYAVAQQIPELRSAFDHYRSAIPETVEALRAEGVDVVGHWHPRSPGTRNFWRSIGVQPVEDWDSLLGRLSALVADNTSALPEAMAVGGSAVFLNTPVYRRDVIHGGRFWTWPRGGFSCDDPADLTARVLRALGGPPPEAQEVALSIYGPLGGAAERAAAAIREWSAEQV